ncbi:MAG: TolC family protein [Spirochaetaceae bacterium]|jgi:outer membrane protein TolC|nr:TolC family protein [Spirochaetaceae bacterium]
MIRFVKGRWRKVSGPGGGDRFKTAVLVCVLTAASAAGAFAQAGAAQGGPQAGRRITVDEAVDMAIRNNLELESQRISTEAARRASSLSWNRFLPTLQVGAGLQRSNYEQTVTMGPITAALPRWALFGSLQASLNLGAALFEQVRAARQEYETGLINYEQAKLRIERTVRQSYYDMLFIQEQIALSRESFETTQRQAAMAQTNYRNGLIPETQYLQAQVAVENMKPQMEEAESGLRLAKAAFANNLGLPVDAEFELVPLDSEVNYVSLEVADLVSRAASGSPTVQELQRQIISLRSSRTQTFLSLYTPSLALSWSATAALSGDPWKDSWFDSANWPQPLNGNFSVQLGFQLNGLLPFTTQGQGLRTLDDNLKKLNIGLAQAVRGTELQIYQTVSSLEQARLSVEAQAYTVELAQRSYRMTEQAYRSGASELLEVRNAELQLFQARLSVLQQQYAYLKGLIDLEYYTGVPFGALSSRESAR